MTSTTNLLQLIISLAFIKLALQRHIEAPSYLKYLYDTNLQDKGSKDIFNFCGIPNKGVEIISGDQWKISFPVKQLKDLNKDTTVEFVMRTRKTVHFGDVYKGQLCIARLPYCFNGTLEQKHRSGSHKYWHVLHLKEAQRLFSILTLYNMEEIDLYFKFTTGSRLHKAMPYHVTGSDGPLLVIYNPSASSFKADTQEVQRFRRSVTMTSSKQEADATNSDDLGCKVRSLIVDFEEIGWDWIIFPKRIDSGYCDGVCPKTNIFTMDSRELTNLDNEQEDLTFSDMTELINRGNILSMTDSLNSKCIPTKYDSFSFLYYNSDGNILSGMLQGFIIKECSCRV